MKHRLVQVVLGLLLLAVPATGEQFKMEGKPGEAPGPWIFATIGVGKKDDGTPVTTALKGLALRVGRYGEATVCYDLDLCRMAGAWTGGFVTPMNLMSRGEYPRSIGDLAFASSEVAGFQARGAGSPAAAGGERVVASEEWKDPRSEPFGPLPDAKFRGMYVNGGESVIRWEIDGTEVLEVPRYSGNGAFARCLRIAPTATETVIVLANAEMNVKDTEASAALAPAASDGGLGRALPGDVTFTRLVSIGGQLVKCTVDGNDADVSLIGREGLLCARLGPSKVQREISFALSPNIRRSKVSGGTGAAPEALAEPPRFAELTNGGHARWPDPVVTQGEISAAKQDAYVVDTVKTPDQNPWNAPMFIGGFDFFPDGRAAVCTFHGDVFVVSGLDAGLDRVVWRRFASGLYHALGLKVVNGEIYVTCRDGITRLKDLNGDGEADFYERFNNDLKVTKNFHEFVFDLQTDPAGNFFFAKAGPVKNGGRGFDQIMDQHGTLMRVSPDGKTLDVVATGLRAPNGIGISPDGQLVTGDNEGTWTPACRINWVEKGGFYGCVPTSHRVPPPSAYDKPLCWMPKRVDNSSGGQVWVPDGDRWGPWRGEMLHLSYGQCTLFGVVKERYEDPQKPDCCDQGMQGGVVQFPLKFQSGIMRARFNPADGQLYVAGLRGWQTTALKNGCLQRVRYTGAPVRMPIALHAKKDGMEVRFTCSLDTQKACDPENWNVEVWNYLWSGAYGSPEISTVSAPSEKPSEPGKDGELQYSASDLVQKHHDTLAIKSATVGTDDRTVFLEIPGLKPVMQMSIKYQIRAADGADLRGEIVNTINGLGE